MSETKQLPAISLMIRLPSEKEKGDLKASRLCCCTLTMLP